MALPALLASGMAVRTGRSLLKKGAKKPTTAKKDGLKRRRRRARLTGGDIMELTHIKNILGRTAAANALPYYLGRGRG